MCGLLRGMILRCVGLAVVVGLSLVHAAELVTERELIGDNSFQRGFTLWETKPGKHVRYGELKGFAANAAPVWGLSQWSSKFPLNASNAVRVGNSLVWSNSAKLLAVNGEAGLSMAVNSAAEYGLRARLKTEPWVHLLIEQEFAKPAPLSKLNAARLQLEARLIRSRNLHQGDYSADRHAAQFQLFFTIQNRNRQSKGYGDLLWFGVPIYDNRDRFPKEFKAQDFGGTAKFIFTPAGKTFSKESAHDEEWITIDEDVLPLMRDALETAWVRGFLKDSKATEDYCISGMNMGWELPGTFDIGIQIRGLSLKVKSPVEQRERQ